MRPLPMLGCRQPSRALANDALVDRDGPHPAGRAGAGAAQCEPSSCSPAVPPACHSQRSSPVASGQPRTTPKRHRPVPFTAFAGDDPARSGFASRGSSRTI